MSRREAWVSAALVAVVAFAVRAWAASWMPFPTPEDAAYYWGVARNVVDGHGLVSNAIWSYLTPALDPATGAFGLFFPRPAFEIWLPLPSLLAALPMAIAGSTTYPVSLVVPVVLGSLIPVLAWRLGADLAAERGLPPERARTLAVGSGIVSAVALPLVLPSAILDSTAPFGVAALTACLLMTRLVEREPRGAWDARLLALGVAIGLAGLTRSEAIWIGLAWALLVAAHWRRLGWRRVVALVAVPAVVAVVTMAPWLARDWLTFGSPLPGQAATNALSLSGYDIFAWLDRPSLARYLAAGLPELLTQRLDALGHNLVDVLIVPGFPVAPLGLLTLPAVIGARSLRPLLLVATLTFVLTTLAFPVATLWGTFLHASAPITVLLVVTALAALDAGLAAIGRRRGWTRPVAWLGAAFAVFGSVLFLALGIPAYGAQAAQVERTYRDVVPRLAAAGVAIGPDEPVIASHPMWLAEAGGVRALALPDEPVASVLDLARTFGARIVVVDGTHDRWPGLLAADPDSGCLAEVDLPGDGSPAAQIRAWRITCP